MMLAHSFKSSIISLRAQFGQQLTGHYGKPYSISTRGRGQDYVVIFIQRGKKKKKNVYWDNFTMLCTSFLRLAIFLLLLD